MESIFYSGQWWRFAEYEVKAGYICPVPGAPLQAYDPLDEFQESRGERGESESPYQSLLKLVERNRFDAEGNLSNESRELVLAWCKSNGLLGLLLHRVQQVAFAPRWERRFEREVSESDRKETAALLARLERSQDKTLRKVAANLKKSRPPKERLFATARTYRRTNWGTIQWGKEQDVGVVTDYDARRIGRPIDNALWGETAARALVQDLQVAEWRFEPVDRAWGRYFPSVKSTERLTFDYPEPYTEAFWRLYAEPLSDFLDAARMFRDAFLAAAAMKEADLVSQVKTPNVSGLNAMVTPTGPCILKLRGGSMEQHTVSTSLLGSLAIMAQQDLATDRRVIRCHNEKCRLIVVAVGYQTKFCSAQCRHAVEKRDQRARKKESAGKAAQRKIAKPSRVTKSNRGKS